MVMVFNATFNNSSIISWRSVLLVKETVEPGENHRPAQVTDKFYHIFQSKYISTNCQRNGRNVWVWVWENAWY